METTGDEISCHYSKAASVGCLGIGESALYQGFWIFAEALENMKDFQQNFNALDTDLLRASLPKSGTVWLKALVFAIINRTLSPHDLVPFVDFKHVYPDCSFLDFTKSSSHNLDDSICRLIATHIPYSSLPDSVIDNIFISTWNFVNKMRTLPESNNKSTPPLSNMKKSTPLSIEDAFELFCDGVSDFGPYWDHVHGYWKESLERPCKVLFLKYEDLKKEPEPQLKKLAEFLGHRVIKEILILCSFHRMKNLDVNKRSGLYRANKDIFRKGEVGDSKNYLTPGMVERLDRLMKEKLHGSGLTFQNYTLSYVDLIPSMICHNTHCNLLLFFVWFVLGFSGLSLQLVLGFA
ncbi:hypothetical protein MKX03_008588 [Papaver bracteatum]|nr:hypothetical protein MKX03_008588 [Papaver bracteatum]